MGSQSEPGSKFMAVGTDVQPREGTARQKVIVPVEMPLLLTQYPLWLVVSCRKGWMGEQEDSH